MTAAAILICTTLVTNSATGTTVTRECQAEAPKVEAALESRYEIPPLWPITAAASKPAVPQVAAIATQENAVVQKLKPVAVTVRHIRPRHTRLAIHVPRHNYAKAWRKVLVMPTGSDVPQPAKQLSFWDKLKKLPELAFKPSADQ